MAVIASQQEYHLNRLDLFGGEITATTPNIVIYEVANAHGIVTELDEAKFSNETLIRYIHETPTKVVKEPISHEGWRYIARYINPHVSNWKDAKLLRDAFHFLWKLRQLDLTQITSSFEAGPQTPDMPYSINGCLLYGFCLKHNIKTWPEMSYDELSFAVRSLLLPHPLIISRLVDQLRSFPQNQLINACLALYRETHLLPTNPTLDDLSHERLDQAYDLFNDLYRFGDRVLFRETSEAVAMVARRYHLDISSSKCPFDELKRLVEVGEIDYHPADPEMAKYYAVNPQLYYLSHHFNPLFPDRYYTRDILENLQRKSGYRRDNRVSIYSQLCEIYLCNSFYHGRRPGIKNSQSPFELEDVEKVSSNSTICYGNPVDGFTFFTYSELADFFRVNRAFLHPLERGKQLTPEEISRLRHLTEVDFYPYDDSASKEERRKLFTAMTYVDIFNSEVEDSLQDFLHAYESAEPNVKKQIVETFMKLFYVAMYMRGWLGPSNSEEPYPIETAPNRPYGEVSIRVTEALHAWKTQLQEIGPNWADKINNLPLVRYEGGFIVSNDHLIGQTIGEKIEIVERGEDHISTIGSCIRSSSGWLAASSHRYMTLIGCEPPFEINKLIYVT
jgi:hypothetical protein